MGRVVGWWVVGAGCRRLGGASRGENVLVAQSHGVTSIHGSGTGSRIHTLCGAKSHHSNQLFLNSSSPVCLYIANNLLMFNYQLHFRCL